MLASKQEIEDRTLSLTNDEQNLNFKGFPFSVADKDFEYADATYIKKNDKGQLIPVTHSPHEPNPRTLLNFNCRRLVPEEWKKHFSEGFIPFLPNCPKCDTQTTMISIIEEAHINNVMCASCESYLWCAVTGKHYKDRLIWDPKDPEGKKAKSKLIAELRAEINKITTQYEEILQKKAELLERLQEAERESVV